MRIWHESCTFKPQTPGVVAAGALWLWAVSAAAAPGEDLSRLQDPTRPQTGVTLEAPTPDGPVLQSTLISPTSRRATIGGRSYKVGDRVDGGVVTDIQPYEVTLRQGTQLTHLRLLPKLIKEPKATSGKGPG